MQLLQVQYTSLAIQYSIAKQSFNILNMHLSLDELWHQIQPELHPSDFSCVPGIQYDQLVYKSQVSNFLQMIHSFSKFLKKLTEIALCQWWS